MDYIKILRIDLLLYWFEKMMPYIIIFLITGLKLFIKYINNQYVD